MPSSLRKAYPARIALVIALVAVWSILILLRLGQLQILQHDQFLRLARERQEVTRAVLAPRGTIYDSRMNELASSVPVSTVVAEPRRIRDLHAAAASLAGALDLDPAELKRRMAEPDHQAYLVVKRRIDPRAEARLEELGLEGVYLEEESMRVYPHRELACHVLGFVNLNGDGGGGLETQYDRELKGVPGLISFDVDARRRSFRGQAVKPPVQGHSLVLALDRSIQYVAERELAAAVEEYDAASGVVVVMETDTGRILALATRPNFNCNTYNAYEADLWRNRAVSDIFEPGSTFKVVVATAALEQGLTHPMDLIDCQMGSIRIGRHVFHDVHPYGLLTFTQVLEKSSNVGATKLGLRLGEERLYRALLDYGFGSKTGIDLPGEIVGLVRDWRVWSGLSIGAISFGQEVGVTSLQMLTAINIIASGGYRVRPTIVDRIIDAEGNLLGVTEPRKDRVVSARTAAAVSDAFEGVILRGTGKEAALEGFRAAGKTGTAQKIVNGQYSDTAYLSSFIGFAPLPNPKITVLVQIDEPKGAIYGGRVAAPVFRRVTQQALIHMRVPPDRTLPLRKPDPTRLAAGPEDFIPNATPIMPRASEESEGPVPGREEVIVVSVPGRGVVIPDFRGMSKRRVVDRCQELGIRMQPTGSGIAVFQFPPPGTEIPIGRTCSVTFAKTSAGARMNLPSADNGRMAHSKTNPGPEPVRP